MTILPAYGRDYKNKKNDILKDWEDNKDFQICDLLSDYDGSYINKHGAKQFDLQEFNVRYAKKTKVAILKLKGGVWVI